MGYVYNGDIVAQQLYDVTQVKSGLSDAVLNSILTNKKPSLSTRYAPSNLATDIVRAFGNNYANNVEKYYGYGRNRHSDGIPTNTVENFGDPTEIGTEPYNTPHPDIQGIIDTLVGEPVVMEWYAYSPPNVTLLINDYFVKTAGYSLFDNAPIGISQLKFLVGGTTYEIDRTIFQGSIITVYAFPMQYIDDVNLGEEDPFWERWGPETQFTIDLSTTNGIVSTKIYHQVLYRITSTGVYDIWFYDESDDLYPSIHGSVPIGGDAKGSYPFAMLIEDGNNVNNGDMGATYKDETNGLLKTIGLDLDILMDGLENPNNANALDDVKDAFLLYAINLDDDTESSLQYLYEHFRHFYYSDPATIDGIHATWADSTNIFDLTSMHFYNNRVQFSLFHRWMRITVKTGNVTAAFAPMSDAELRTVHPHIAEIDANNVGTTTNVNGVVIGKVTKQVVLGVEESAASEPHSLNTHQLILRKQLTATTYVEILIMGIAHYTRITGFGDIANYASDTQVNTLEHLANGKVFLPVSYDVMEQFNTEVRTTIFYSSLSVVLHLLTATWIPWYANEGLWMAVRIFLLIVTWGGSELWVEGIFAVLQSFVMDLIMNALLMAAFSLLIDLIGGEAALIIAAIATVVALVAGVVDSPNQVFELIDAAALLQGATLLIEAVNRDNVDNFLELEEYAAEQRALIEGERDALAALEAQITSKEVDIIYSITRPPIQDFYETPENFFNRTVHLTNPGVLSLDTIDVYTQNLLTLPKLKEI